MASKRETVRTIERPNGVKIEYVRTTTEKDGKTTSSVERVVKNKAGKVVGKQ